MNSSKIVMRNKNKRRFYNKISNEKRLKLHQCVNLLLNFKIAVEGKSLNDASEFLNIKYSTAKSLLQIMKKKGTIVRYFKEKPKRIFKICKDCVLGKLCKKVHSTGSKIHLQKTKDSNQILYSFKNSNTSKIPMLKPKIKKEDKERDIYGDEEEKMGEQIYDFNHVHTKHSTKVRVFLIFLGSNLIGT
jgi:mevalonate pyrophosphate decarboxylase